VVLAGSTHLRVQSRSVRLHAYREATVCRFVSCFRLFAFLAQTFLFAVLSQLPSSANQPAGQKDSLTPLADVEARASSGDPAAEFQLAFHLFQTGHPPNYPLILNLLRSSTAQNYAPAHCMLGYLYEKALGLPRDYSKAAENYRAAALQGYVIAQNNLANLYYTGQGVHKNLDSAFEWYRVAAEHGNANAERNFGFLYYKGEGTRRDYTVAARWFRASAEQGDCQSEDVLGYLYYKGLGVPIDYKEAARWKSLAAEQGDPNAQADLGFLYESGKGVPLDHVTAYLWYSRATAGGLNTAAQRRKSLAEILTLEQLKQAQALLTTDAAQPQTSCVQSPASASATFAQNY
jgi:TPR repeat protein